MADLSQLAASGLPSLNLGGDNLSWNRSLRELQVASDSVWAQSQNSGAPASGGLADSGGASILGNRRLPELGRIAGAAENDSQPERDFLHWEDANRRRERDIMKQLVQRAETTIRSHSLHLHEQKMQEHWEKTRDLWKKELVGKRNLGGSGGSVAERDLDVLLLENSVADTSIGPLSSGLGQIATNNMQSGTPADPQALLSHLEIVRRLNQKDYNVTDLAEAADELGKLSKSSGPIGSKSTSCYDIPLQLVSRILLRQNMTPTEIALATLGLLSSQFDTLMVSRVRNTGSGKDGFSPLDSAYTSPNANTIATFVSTELGSTMETSVWSCLYYCLRIGDAVAAKEIFESNPAENESEGTVAAISSALSSLVERQGAAPSIWEAFGPLMLPAQETRIISEACELTKATNHQQNLHRAGFLSLLAGGGPISGPAIGFSTIEDYLYGLLWKAIQNSSPVVELENVGKHILQLGAGYFGDQDSGGWLYSFPLLASQQFRTALSHLVQAGGSTGLMQATHLGMLLSSRGLDLNNLGESDPQATGSLITWLLVNYSNLLHGDPNCGAVCALEYLLWIPNRNAMMSEVVALILRTNDIYRLAGTLSPEGKRQNGALDNYFSAKDVSLLLKQAGEKCFKDAKDRDRRISSGILYMLAGDFRSVIVMMSRLMSPDTDVQNEEKRFWYQQSQTFFSMYLDSRTHVVEALEKNGDLDVVNTCKALMELFKYFVSITGGALNDAWSTLDRLNIIPNSQSDIAEKEIRYKELDPLLQKPIPSVLMTAMQSLHHEHVRLKREMHSGDKGTTLSRLSELKERARVLIAFAGVISDVPQTKFESMSSMEASMI